MGKHKAGCYDYDYHWDQEDLSLNYTRVNCELDPEYDELGEVVNPPTPGIPFADLAINVNSHPSYARGDGSMLTRCIQYAALHPDEDYIFQRDFAYLAEKLDDGRQILPQHLDRASAARWLRKSTWLISESPHVETFEGIDGDGIYEGMEAFGSIESYSGDEIDFMVDGANIDLSIKTWPTGTTTSMLMLIMPNKMFYSRLLHLSPPNPIRLERSANRKPTALEILGWQNVPLEGSPGLHLSGVMRVNRRPRIDIGRHHPYAARQSSRIVVSEPDTYIDRSAGPNEEQNTFLVGDIHDFLANESVTFDNNLNINFD
ncbi:hypothetical protein BKA63DRAFT_567935 [Paraphoma chrysanthemicola]|nr:hypothetical protein BKA63DRAFT_567935 [Paraphoma chrysanthemicola]